MAISTKDIRNVVVISHSGEGKTSLVEDLLYGLSNIHKLTFSATYTNCVSGQLETIDNFKSFHFDINPQNILVRHIPEENRWEAVISDFGTLGDWKHQTEVKHEKGIMENLYPADCGMLRNGISLRV